MRLNKQQRLAATYDGSAKNILVIAGAGTGKTTTIVARIVYLLQSQQLMPERILALTFTNKSAKELVSRIGAEIPTSSQINACTFHSFCIQIIRMLPKSFGYGENPPIIIDRSDQNTLMSDSMGAVLADYDESYLEYLKALLPKPAKLAELYSFSRNSMMPFTEYVFKEFTEEQDVVKIMEQAIAKYESQKAEFGYADFDDLLHRFVTVVESKPVLAQSIAELYDEVLVDELQDTNPVQYRVLKALGGGLTRLFGVGDPAQSIYGFRGADFNSIYNFKAIFPNSTTIALSENYRSSQEILDFSNRILQKSSLSYENELVSPNGYTGESVRFYDFDNGIQEAKFITTDILNYVTDEKGDFQDIFVITRSAYSAKEVEAMMNKYQIPYTFVGGQSIMKTAHVQDLLAILRFSVSPSDKLACIRFLSLFKGVGSKTATKFYETIKDISSSTLVLQHLKKTVKKDSDRITRYYQAVVEASQQRENPIKALMDEGFEQLIKERYYDSYDYRIKDLRMFIDFFKQYHGDVRAFINDFTIEPDMFKSQKADEEDNNKVTLITAHSSKGLEKKRCYLLNVRAGNFPSSRSIGSTDAEEEERRTFYVAATRAKETLILTMVYQDYSFYNAKTSVDYVKDTDDLLVKEKQRIRTQLGGLHSLKDVF